MGEYAPPAVDDQPIRLRAAYQLVESAGIEKDETCWTALGDRPSRPAPMIALLHPWRSQEAMLLRRRAMDYQNYCREVLPDRNPAYRFRISAWHNIKKKVWWGPHRRRSGPQPSRQIAARNQRFVSDTGGVQLRCGFTPYGRFRLSDSAGSCNQLQRKGTIQPPRGKATSKGLDHGSRRQLEGELAGLWEALLAPS